jgi:hypothetical protein
MTDRTPQVYLLRLGDTDYFKVGMTTDINGRLSSLQTATPFDLHLITVVEHENAFTVEKDIHASLVKYHVRNEWFQCEQTEIVRIFEVVSAMATLDRALDRIDSDQEIGPITIPPRSAAIDKDQAIASMLRQGYGYRQIGRELGVSHERIATVSRLLQSIMPVSPTSDDDLNDAAI